MSRRSPATPTAPGFITQREAPKVDEIGADEHVNVAMQSSFKFVSISGSVSPVDDRAKIAELWNEGWRTWFPGGKDDPSLVLLRVTGESGAAYNTRTPTVLRCDAPTLARAAGHCRA